MQYKNIQVVPYNPKWPYIFEREATLLKNILGMNCVHVHHIGSTAIPGLSAKEDIDILCIVDQLCDDLEGYVFKGEFNVPLRHYFSKKFSKFNLHMVEKDHGFIELNLCFRNYLRSHPKECQAYADLKIHLLQDPRSYEKRNSRFTGYTLDKNDFIKNILAQSGFEGLCVNFCMHDNEWEAYDRFFPNQAGIPFVLYKGATIVAVAQLVDQTVQAFPTSEIYQDYVMNLRKVIEKWRGIFGMYYLFC